MNQGSPPPGVPGQTDATSASKRRRMSIVDEGNILSEARKRKRGDLVEDGAQAAILVPARTPEEYEQVRQAATILYDKLMQQRDPNDPNRFLREAFLELPDPTLYPEYYDKIKKPVCLSQIKEKLDNLSYISLLDAKTDMNQIFVNAKRFNAPGSPLFLDAKKLHKNLKTTYAVLTGEAPPPEEEEPPAARRGRRDSSSLPVGVNATDDADYVDDGGHGGSSGGAGFSKRGPTLKPWLLKKFDQLVRKTDPQGRVYADVFRVLPDKKSWPEYYQYITQPISLDNILAKVNARKYKSVDQFKQDVETSFGNAMFFNEEHSQIWQDARTMLDHFAEIMKEVPPVFAPPRRYNTAKRRAQEAEALAGGYNQAALEQQDTRARSTQPQAQQHHDSQQDSPDEDESGEESDTGGDFSTQLAGSQQHFSNPFAAPATYNNVTAPSPVASYTPQSIPVNTQVNLQVGGGPDADALASLATLASSISPQRAAHLALPNPNLGQTEVGSSASRSAQVDFSSLPIAKMPGLGEIPLISEFTISAVLPTGATARQIKLANVQVRQHSFAVPALTNRIEIEVSPQIDMAAPSIQGSCRPDLIPLKQDSTAGSNRERFVVVPRKGLNVVEFVAKPKPHGYGIDLSVDEAAPQDEVYRLFLTK
ncbi:bromodomain-containing protein [Sporobolomyces koalae]|uniref:bromodomain-containing protein n=1 Tax=Sporobolomyces koalae TaxID=500713 RepID=UPI00317CC505